MIIIFISADNDGNLKVTAIEFEEIYQNNKVKLYNFILYKVNKDSDLAEEILSETILSALQSFSKLKDKSKAGSWLYQIANRRFIDHLRKKYKSKKIFEDKKSEILQNASNESVPDILEDENRKAVLLKAGLENLKPKYREIIKLKFIENRSQKEIAQIFDLSVKSAESLIFRAREALKKEVEKLDAETLR